MARQIELLCGDQRVAGPSAVTSVDGALVLRKAAARGSAVEELEEGGSYLVDVRLGPVQTSAGRLCAPVPAAWFEAVSATPSQCEVEVGGQVSTRFSTTR